MMSAESTDPSPDGQAAMQKVSDELEKIQLYGPGESTEPPGPGWHRAMAQVTSQAKATAPDVPADTQASLRAVAAANVSALPSDILICHYCYKKFPAELDIFAGVEPRQFPQGVGLCKHCGGYPDSKRPEKRLGKIAMDIFHQRLPQVPAVLSPTAYKNFISLDLESKVVVVLQLLEQGAIK